MNGGDLVAEVLQKQGVRFLFTLCGGHISPILVGCKDRGIRVIDTRHEVNAVFAADAVARLSGTPGVAAVTAGPGVTNTITAIKNAQLAQSPVILLGGATATVLRGRGALQDIDQIRLFEPHVKWATSVKKVRDLVSVLEEAFVVAQEGVPGPVFVECPVDLLYDQETVREMYGAKGAPGKKPPLSMRLLSAYLNHHAKGLFRGVDAVRFGDRHRPNPQEPSPWGVRRAAGKLAGARRPVMLVGSQALLETDSVDALVVAIERLGVPVYLTGMARGLLGAGHPLQVRHKRRQALKEADVVILAGVVADFRLEYGLQIPRRATLIAANRSLEDLYKNRRPNVAVLGDAGRFVRQLSDRLVAKGKSVPGGRWDGWIESLRERDGLRDAEIESKAQAATDVGVNPLEVCRAVEELLPEDSILVVDGGDFVASASYVVRPRGPLSWLDPGAFGTLGVGAGFALGAKLCRPDAEVWIIYGDGSVGYSLPEFDTFVRHEIPVIALVGNDASWQQIARDQIVILGDAVGTELRRTAYHQAAEGFGGAGLEILTTEAIRPLLRAAQELAAEGRPVLVNAQIGASDFREGSISI
ncbi:MAG: thiamine pyrophosphate-binding protein [Thermoanaerobaculia bacterium]|nr:thiamine pyrophosphate-binding protein [Thermoanaerobaculia bacterium]